MGHETLVSESASLPTEVREVLTLLGKSVEHPAGVYSFLVMRCLSDGR
jgi:hypothetical protein